MRAKEFEVKATKSQMRAYEILLAQLVKAHPRKSRRYLESIARAIVTPRK